MAHLAVVAAGHGGVSGLPGEPRELREVFATAKRYVEGNASLHELNGAVAHARDTAKLAHAAAPILAVLEDWLLMIDRRWNEWGHVKNPLSEADFVEWLREQLLP